MKKFFMTSVIFFFVVTFMIIPIVYVYQFDGNFLTTYEDVERANRDNLFGNFVVGKLRENSEKTDMSKPLSGEIVFKLFGIIPIRKMFVNIASDDKYYVGGNPMGFEIDSDGLIVVSGNEYLRRGDIITSINGVKTKDIESIEDNLTDSEVEITYLRDNKKFKTLAKLLKTDEKYKLGVSVKDSVTGVGTLSFIDAKTGEFRALGHAVVDESGKNIIPVEDGKVYSCNLIGINKGERNNPGQLRCVFLQNSDSKGDIFENSKFGIKGNLDNKKDFVDENMTAELGGRLSVVPGKAKLVSSVSGMREEYDIEIIKTNYQKKKNEKSMVIRVVDKRLLELTGGIVQGMSGSPILQNGKIVGAITHVFLSDSTKGYAVYSDWML